MATNNPVTGQFGTGNVQFFAGIIGTASVASTFVVPQGISSVRVRLWGAGSSGCGAGGFAMKTIYGLVPGTSIVVTPGASSTASTTSFASSFGSYVSATGATGVTAGTGVGGDVNYTGGTGVSPAGAGAPSIYGNGTSSRNSSFGPSGFSGAGTVTSTPANNTTGGDGLFGKGGASFLPGSGGFFYALPTSGMDSNTLNLDAIGTGGGGACQQSGVNGGGGGGGSGNGGFPAGGGGASSSVGGAGLVIVEC